MPQSNRYQFVLRLYLLGIFTIGLGSIVMSQPNISKADTSKTMPFDTLVKNLEAKFPVYLYFNKSQTDSLKIPNDVNFNTIETALSQVFAGTDFKYSIDKDKRVYITKGQKIQTDLPFQFFEPVNLSANNQTPDFLEVVENSKLKAGIENKIFEIGPKTDVIKPGNAILSGRIKDSDSGEPMVGAVIFSEKQSNLAVATDAFGYFSITLPKGKNNLQIKSVGMKSTKRQIILYADGKLNIDMYQDVVALREVLIQKDKDANISRTTMGIEKLDMKTMKQVPSVFGEADVLRVVMALPGVQTVGESSAGLNVRGGATDQNLILFNDATIYNPTHLFGFFSAFNPDIIKDVELYKSSIPSEYGGRLASVLSISSRDGNKKKIGGSGGIGLLTGRLTIEGPIFKDKTSFMLSGRSTYSNWLLKQVPSKTIQQSAAAFYDFNGHISHEFDEKNNLKVSGYYSYDQFRLGSDTTYSYSNKAIVAKWSHIFNNKFYGVFTSAYSGYDYGVENTKNAKVASRLTYSLNQASIKADFHYNLGAKHLLDFGAISTFYHIDPGTRSPIGTVSEVALQKVEAEKGLESAVYIADKFDITPRFSLYAGIRYSVFNYLGSKTVTNYVANLPLESANAEGTTTYKDNEIIKTYHGPELRLSMKYSLTESASIKASYNRTRQYISMLSNTTAIAPTDIWKLSDQYIKPQIGDQYSVGIYKNFRSSTIELSAEAYYKDIKDAINFKNGATLIVNPNIETAIVNAKGYAYGAEFMVKKNTGKLNGWISYTYSRSFAQINDPQNNTVVNRGNYFPTNFDKPHSVNFIGNYKLSHRLSVSLNIVYSTGRPITFPVGKATIDGVERPFYSDRNQYRIPDYFRADLSVNIEGNHKIKKLAHSSWSVGIYNLTGRKNVYSIYFQSENGVLKGYSLAIFGSPIPTITYNFRF